MNTVSFDEEKKLWKRGSEVVAGLDEAGRGPLAGPVVAAAVSFAKGHVVGWAINDSKKLSPKQREVLYQQLMEDDNIIKGVGIVSEKTIDQINILQATKLAMQKAIEQLNHKSQITNHKEIEFLLIDGNFLLDLPVSQKAVVKGDSKVFSIAAASIIAKVTRDRLMQTLHQKYPQYGFDLHKGYGTALHIKKLKEFGACPAHRKTFYPVSALSTV